ncbi:MAG TPA: efflux RND transporter periplasmic adaptor subunit [Acidobacteriaceae bacterium]|nr:efflux RND transporter periplasmic adaptor subunit [Acidobacteriaceae bacterium]
MKRRTLITLLIAALLILAGLAVVFRPAAIPVQAAWIRRGSLREIVEEEGKTRMHDHFVLAATVTGKLRRVELHAGDRVYAGQRVAWIDPAPIDPRQNAILQARLRVALAAQQESEAVVGRSEAESQQIKADLARGQALYNEGIISKQAFEKAVMLDQATEKQLQAARAGAQAAAYQVEEARSALLVHQDDLTGLPTAILSPMDGRVLKLLEQSERVVGPGTPVMEIGYSPRLELVADFLTRDAMRIKPGNAAMITDWGGDTPIPARVRMVEPSAFTKVSALGVEEQRVNVICDFTGSSHGLEDAYHVEVRVITWENPDVLLVPSSAIFRLGEEWAVFLVRNGTAHRVIVRLGHRGENDWEVLQGLHSGDRVITYPSTDVKDGARVRVSG